MSLEMPHDPRLHDLQINNPLPDYDPAYDPYEILTSLEKAGFNTIIINIDGDQPRLLFGIPNPLKQPIPSRDEVVEALRGDEIHLDPDRLKPTSYGNFYEVTF